LVYTLMHSAIGHVSINDTSAVLTYCLMIKRIIRLGILWYLHQDITYESIRAFYATADEDEEDVYTRPSGQPQGDKRS
jgi:hypothetical protein